MKDQEEARLVELIAMLEHAQWTEWTKKLVLCGERISKKRLERWQKLWVTPYDQLPAPEQNKDREYARRVIVLLGSEGVFK